MRAGGSKFRASSSGHLRTQLNAFKKDALAQVDAYRAEIVMVLTEKVLERTPVWEGESIVNWQWSVGGPAANHIEPIGGVPTGRTSEMALGEEPRRPANEAMVRQSMRLALAEAKGKLVDLWLSNNGSIIELIEFGGAPTAESSRAPGGVLRLAVREVEAGF